ncbi:MAG: 50S ribosomal protein L11 methyltransferase [Deltaproteobacteria bacterium]|jgi:ribosomal protein L11 methyltransferase|nr:50S ribosomal protein L11 methyltransferase [Deltaproteobacteria bacterium]
MAEWLSVTLAVPPPAQEAASSALFDLGAKAVWEDVPDKEGRILLKASFPREDAMRLMRSLPQTLREAAAAFGLPVASFGLILELVPLVDYTEAWKAGLEPIMVSGSLILSPSFWEGDLAGRFGLAPEKLPPVLRIDPGAAFGSGRHPTTFLCLRILSSLAEAGDTPGRILDIGTGSGILALAAAILFPEAEVTGIDNDPPTVPVAIANRDLNSMGPMPAFSDDPLSGLEPGFHLILANITLNTLMLLAPEITRLAARKASLVLSGLIEAQAEEAARAFRKEGWAWTRHLGQGEWSALCLELGGKAAGGAKHERVMVPEPSLETRPGNEG